jgi:hypothetical protein
MSMDTWRDEKIITQYERKPGPSKSFDWSAVTENYDGAPDANSPIGYGATEDEAIADLKMEIEARA